MQLSEFVVQIDKRSRKLQIYNNWVSVKEGIPQILVETLDSANSEFYPGIYVATNTLLTYPVSACAAERSSIFMKADHSYIFT